MLPSERLPRSPTVAVVTPGRLMLALVTSLTLFPNAGSILSFFRGPSSTSGTTWWLLPLDVFSLVGAFAGFAGGAGFFGGFGAAAAAAVAEDEEEDAVVLDTRLRETDPEEANGDTAAGVTTSCGEWAM